MGLEVIDTTRTGVHVPTPSTREEWREWVSAGRTRNYVMGDPLLDWLALYGQDRAYIPKSELETYRPDLDFTEFIFDQGRRFEEGIVRLLSRDWEVRTIAETHHDISNADCVKYTFDAMKSGVPVIFQGVLWDADTRTYGAPDLLFRSDVLHEMFPTSILLEEANQPAPDLEADWHYRVVDVKFSNLHLNASGTEVSNSGSLCAYKVQVHIYNNILGRLQGYEPDTAYLLGRGWERRSKGNTERGFSAFDRLGPVPQDGMLANRLPIRDGAAQAVEWIRRVRREGSDWDVLPVPSLPELYPNVVNHDDGGLVVDIPQRDPDPYDDQGSETKWVGVKKWLAGELKDLTMLWGVGVAGRRVAHEAGIFSWDSPGLSPADVNVKGPTTAPTLESILRINTSSTGPVVWPERITAGQDRWRTRPPLEFYVDFEFCSDLNDDFSALPEKGGQPLIFMIGCGHAVDGQWRFKSLVADRLTEAEELRIIGEWFDYMKVEADSRGLDLSDVPIIHWSKAEITSLETAYNSARARHGHMADWRDDLAWYDFLQEVMRSEPVVVRGAMGFGLKSVAKSLHTHGLIETNWTDNEVDGLGAMVGAWRCDEEAQSHSLTLMDTSTMVDIAIYNEVDCRVMFDIVEYLRTNH